jgi:aminoglycoside/choline kinase family phosphotransferase
MSCKTSAAIQSQIITGELKDEQQFLEKDDGLGVNRPVSGKHGCERRLSKRDGKGLYYGQMC